MTGFAGFPDGAPENAQTVPTVRLRELVAAPVRSDGEFVLYWMVAVRRPHHNFALQHARDLARTLDRPLLIVEALGVDYPWASERLHAFVLDGMGDNAASFASTTARYAAYLERAPGAGRGMIEALGRRACAVVTDDFPAFFLPRAIEALRGRLPIPLVAVDSNGLLPLRRGQRAFPTARGFRRRLHDLAAECLAQVPEPRPLRGIRLPMLAALPTELHERWTPLTAPELDDVDALITTLPIDHRVRRAPMPGGCDAAASRLRSFLGAQLPRYGDDRNHPDEDGQSGFSPYLHFGHLSTHQVLAELDVDPARFDRDRAGKREGFYRAEPHTEAFLDQLLTWRELAFNGAVYLPDYDQYPSLPAWARATLDRHRDDPRPERYEFARLDAAETSDALWNAAQRQLVREGRMHNYLRMLWGKRLLEWSGSPEEAFSTMVQLNDRYAVDGRDPNSTAGIAWVLGRYDRAWGPERAIFGTIRYMSSKNTARKLRLGAYLERHAA